MKHTIWLMLLMSMAWCAPEKKVDGKFNYYVSFYAKNEKQNTYRFVCLDRDSPLGNSFDEINEVAKSLKAFLENDGFPVDNIIVLSWMPILERCKTDTTKDHK